MRKIFFFLLALLIINFVSKINAQEAFEQRSFKEALNIDGTLKRGIQGSFNLNGYIMRTNKNNEPIFISKTNNSQDGTWEVLGTSAQNGVNSQVNALAVDGQGRLYVGGGFTQAGNVSANYVARYDPISNTWSSLGTGQQNGVNGFVYALAVDKQGRVYVGGYFTKAGGMTANNVARFDPSTNTWSTLGTSPGVDGRVNALAIDDQDRVYAGGEFTYAGTNVSRVARFDPVSNTWSALGTYSQNGVNRIVYALALDGQGRLYVGGTLSVAGGISANSVARYDPISNSWNILGTGAQNGVNGTVLSLAIDGQNRVFVGGTFTQAAGINAKNVAIYDPTTNAWNALDSSVNNGVNYSVYAISLNRSGQFYMGGSFYQAGNINANYVAFYNPLTKEWSALVTGTYNGVSDQVRAIVIDGQGRVYVGGKFISAGDKIAKYVARWTPSATIVEQKGDEIPANYILNQNYPNPFNPSTKISFSIPTSEFVNLKVYDMLGREIATLVSENLSAGSYSYNFDARNLTSGVYLYKLQAGKYSEIKKMVLTK